MTKQYSDAYNTGFEAAAQGELRNANPYSSVTWDHDEWFRGFDGDEMTTERRKIVLRISICPTGLEQGFEGDMLDPELLLAEIQLVAAKRWPAAEIEFETLQIGFRQGDEFAECWIDGVRDDEQAQQVVDDVDYSDERLYKTDGASMRGVQKLIYEERDRKMASGLRHIKACVGPEFASNNHECLRVQANSRAYIAILWLDAAFVGTDDYMGLATFWNQEYKHCMREASNRQRQRAHAAMLKAGLHVSGVSDQHLEIIQQAIAKR